MHSSPIEVILFDLGNVILSFSHYQIAEKLTPFCHHKEFQSPQSIFSHLFDLQTGLINNFDLGRISPREFFQSLQESLQLSLSFEEFIPIWNDIFTEDKRVSEMIISLKGKRRLGLLSNTDPLHFEYILSKFPIVWAFDKWILSYQEGLKKPNVKIYQRAIEWASVDPPKILFIDDVKGNVEVAISLGMVGIHFISAQQLKEEIHRQLLDCLHLDEVGGAGHTNRNPCNNNDLLSR
jgi:putative hydrolase of the HAD superfamily